VTVSGLWPAAVTITRAVPPLPLGCTFRLFT
jgi:hypothetical protein